MTGNRKVDIRLDSVIFGRNNNQHIGHKSVASENDLQHRIQFLNAPNLIVVNQSEEHLVLTFEKGQKWKIGDVLYGLPFHICPTCALYESANIVKDHNLVATWKNEARDRTINI